LGFLEHPRIWTAQIRSVSFASILFGLKAITVSIRASALTATAGLRAFSIALLTTPIGWLGLAISGLAFLVYKYWGPISGFFKGLWQGIKEGLKGLEPAWGVFKKAVSFISPVLEPLRYVYNLIKSLLKPIDDTGKAAEGLGYRFGKVIADILTAVLTLPAKMFSARVKIITALYDGIRSVATKPIEAVRNIAQRIRNFFPFSPAKEGPLRDIHRVKLVETIAEAIRSSPLLSSPANLLLNRCQDCMDGSRSSLARLSTGMLVM